MLVCKNCGKENQDHYKFCLGCGTEIGNAPAPRVVARAAESQSVRPAPSPSVEFAVDAALSQSRGTQLDPVPNFDDNTSVDALKPAGMPKTEATPPVGTLKICPNCGATVPDFSFCGQCGARLTPTTTAKPIASTRLKTGDGAALPSSAPRSNRGKLVLIRPDGSEGGMHNLQDGENIIGRGSGSLFDADNYLSPRHAALSFTSQGMLVRDLHSLNGVFVKLADEEELQDHDVFRIGQELLRFDVIHAPAPLEDGTEVMGSPNPGYWGRVALIIGKDQDGSAFPLFGDAVILGRERGDILFPEDGYVSGTHARLSARSERFFLADMNSSNGTFLRVRGERTIRSGTYLLMGQQLFRVQF